MEALISAIISGILLGLAYGLAAIGLNLIWGVMKVINLSHGAFIALGMFASYFLFHYLGISPFVSVVLVLAVGVVLGMIAYFIALHRVISAPELSTLLSTYSLSLIIIGLGTFFFTTNPRAIDLGMGSIKLFGAYIPAPKILTGVYSLIFTLLLYLFLYKTWTGKAIRAVSMNRTAAEFMGINTNFILSLSFGIGIALAMVAGGLIASVFPFTILSGGVYELKSFVICVLGGLGSPLGALVGGLVLGLLENVLTLKLPVGYVPFLEFLILVIILLVKPSGLLGKE
ncbi:branched-chain amino acid transport system permease [Thermosulfidibacter takaii ABI70S6]|uniref:Branched-chain amino acid transport system permease n=1 Tax=Thermosulfidibacter takaii (strain DSM 17441 / JCM 13301 / NBRC 103674 / ABI70S6) TaxID=1298851 RepID=A0A0S3QVT3_THET7|nr:branched-chain amino acid ABC transporter permease [Thermosulfidibacter takaii]BAT72438.1 branched-chain amino acid transport system permease [Thermosulfidibacter takaii ABI70S6]